MKDVDKIPGFEKQMGPDVCSIQKLYSDRRHLLRLTLRLIDDFVNEGYNMIPVMYNDSIKLITGKSYEELEDL